MDQTQPLKLANQVLQSRGGELPAIVRLPLEERFGCGLEDIRVHTDEEAAQAARLLGARAFAFGNHIALGQGERDWSRRNTFDLLAHEIAHCLQQREQRGRVASGIGSACDPAETEAHEAAKCVRQGRPVKSLSPDPSGLIRRVVSLKPGTVTIDITQQPSVNQPAPLDIDGVTLMRFASAPLQFNGYAELDGDPTDPIVGWTLGVIQIEWMETSWAYYRGRVNNHGSLLERRGKRPLTFHHPCRDTLTKGAILVDNRPPKVGQPPCIPLYDRFVCDPSHSFPVKMALRFYDAPFISYKPTMTNPTTQQPNHLREVQVELQFCTILTLLSPSGTYRHLKHLYWNVRWQTRFEPLLAVLPDGPLFATSVPGGTSAFVSPVYEGGPGDRRFADIITSPTAKNCGQEVKDSTLLPHIIPSAVWANFDVHK